jgi:hypothetical protein
MPLWKYFGWLGNFPVAELFAANWCFSADCPFAAFRRLAKAFTGPNPFHKLPGKS